MVFDAGGPLIFNCRYTSFLTQVRQLFRKSGDPD